ncbi:MAG: hypothetical protein JF606_25305 [Burkholderiales bacterium]|jgi:hypothetical protein|nr:hypothetical protein [Burkholderiales bacterium]
MIRIEFIWLALGASNLRGDIDRLLAQVVRGFALGAQVSKNCERRLESAAFWSGVNVRFLRPSFSSDQRL